MRYVWLVVKWKIGNPLSDRMDEPLSTRPEASSLSQTRNISAIAAEGCRQKAVFRELEVVGSNPVARHLMMQQGLSSSSE